MSLEGRLLDGRYAIVRRIAEGGMSTIYLGVNDRIGKDVAVKVLHPVVAKAPESVARFEREARTVARIRSDHVANVFDFGALPTGERFMVMEYLEGESLAAILQRDRTISSTTLATIASQILEALAAAHRAGVVHRDLKPENIIVTTRGKDVIVKVVDFGISKLLDPDSATPVKATAAGAVLGTPLYMSPEQARGLTGLIDQRTDLYALGVILYEATCGEPPLTGDNVNDLLFRVALDEPEPLPSKLPSVDRALAAIVAKAMAKDPAARYQTADDMREDVDAWRVTHGARAFAAGPPSAPSPLRRARVRRRTIAVVASLVGLIVSLFGAQVARRDATSAAPSSSAEAPRAPAPSSGARPHAEARASRVRALLSIADRASLSPRAPIERTPEPAPRSADYE